MNMFAQLRRAPLTATFLKKSEMRKTMKMTRIYVTSLVMPRMYETPLMMLRIYVTTLVMPRSWTHQVMVLGQQLNEFQEYVTILRGEMTACPPGWSSGCSTGRRSVLK